MYLEQTFEAKWKWYSVLITILVSFICVQITAIPYAIWKLLLSNNVSQTTNSTIQSPIEIGLMLFSFVGGVVALIFCYIVLHKMSMIKLITARPRIDWSRIFFSIAIWGGLVCIMTFIPMIGNVGEGKRFELCFSAGNFFATFFISLCLFPFQIGFEELLFRGYLSQLFAKIFRYRYVVLIIIALGFAAMHLANEEIKSFGLLAAIPQYLVMGLILSYVAIKDDGLELSLGMHFINNFLATILVTSSGITVQSYAIFIDNEPELAPSDGLYLLVIGVIYVLVCDARYHFIKRNPLMGKIEPTF